MIFQTTYSARSAQPLTNTTSLTNNIIECLHIYLDKMSIYMSRYMECWKVSKRQGDSL